MTSAAVNPVSPDTPVTVKLTVAGKDEHRKFKLTLKDLTASTLPDKLRQALAVQPDQETTFERYSDSSASYVILDGSNASVYKQLYRAAKAKGKLRLRATIKEKQQQPPPPSVELPFIPSEKLPNRSYVQPYVSDPDADQSPSSRISMLEDFKTLSAAPSTITLTPFTKSSLEAKKERSSAYHWPMSAESGFSECTKAKFEKKKAMLSPPVPPKIHESESSEAPVPGFFDFNDEQFTGPPRLPWRTSCPALSNHKDLSSCLSKLAEVQHRRLERQTTKEDSLPNFVIQCNICDKAISDAHWHCSICDGGDYDICTACIQKGCLCLDEQHWLIKRSFVDGKIRNSVTETIAPRKAQTCVANEAKKDIPGAFKTESKFENMRAPERTCNACVLVYPEQNFVTCMDCDDFDLCLSCHITGKHGHHPGHTFTAAVQGTKLEDLPHKLLAPGRNFAHYAMCDGCDKNIRGVRHKCLTCPDWDYCADCVLSAPEIHPGHRFVPVYEPLNCSKSSAQMHHGICCDGPLCVGKSGYIVGDRYKCAVCHDTDFCGHCEALPGLEHNRTHPLIKFRTPVRNVSISTYGEKPNGDAMRPMGDHLPPTSSKSTSTSSCTQSANAATQVQTVAEVKPSKAPVQSSKLDSIPEQAVKLPVESSLLKAQFVCDTILDGTKITPGTQFTQTWTLTNPGPRPWPVGCSVCFVGGDSMLNVDSKHPSSVGTLVKASVTNSTTREILKGGKADFSITMRTQEREGKAISYWRLKTADGIPFGHRLWCDVDVRKTAFAEQVQDEAEKTEESAVSTKQPDNETHASNEEKVEGSQMIFPKLEKESPVSSLHEPGTSSAPAAATLAPAEQDLLEDVESLELDDHDNESEDAFLTDEEYELIASGDEMEEAKNGKK